MNAPKIPHYYRSGFALVSAVSVLALLVLIGLAVLSLSSSTTREAKVDRHTEIARANARMALAIAIGHLQETMGPDQRVSATADILNNDAPGGVGQQGVIEGREKWLGVWRNTRTVNGIDYPVIGKRPDDDSGNAPYELAGVYSDLRSTDSTLRDGAWKTEMHLSWLVSRGNELEALAEGSVEMEELVSARNSVLDPSTGSTIPAVLVPKVSVEDGNYAYWISEENHKAPIHLTYRDPAASGIADFPHEQTNRVAHLSAAPTVDVSAIRGADGSQPFNDFPEFSPESGNLEQDVRDVRKLVTVNTSALASSDRGNVQIEDFIHDVSVHSQGMAIDPVLGGLKKDLTPLISSGEKGESVTFRTPSDSVALQDFSSDFPIIPGFRHGFSGPKFGSLRHWAQMATDRDNAITAEVMPIGGRNALRARNDEGWSWSLQSNGQPSWSAEHDFGAGSNTGRYTSDGIYTNESRWASEGAKFHPVMTDVRWHYYVSPDFIGGDGGFRFHIIPRVSLWNPYNRPMNVPDLMVLMPNPYAQQSADAIVEWHNDVRNNVLDRARFNIRDNVVTPGTKEFRMWEMFRDWDWAGPTSNEDFVRRTSNPFGISGPRGLGHMRIRTHSGQRSDGDRGDWAAYGEGLVPPTRWLGFVLNAATLAPGQNAVYSPDISSSLNILNSSGIGSSGEYDVDNIMNNRLSANVPLELYNSFYHDFTSEFFSFDIRDSVKKNRNIGPAGTPALPIAYENPGDNKNYASIPANLSSEWVKSGPGQNRKTRFFVPYSFLQTISEFDFTRIRQVYINGRPDESYPFMLKGINPSAVASSVSIPDIVGRMGSPGGVQGQNFPTLQVMLHGNAGMIGGEENRDLNTVGTPNSVTSGAFDFRRYEDSDPSTQSIPKTFVVGAKLLHLNESLEEGAGNTPHRASVWSTPESPASPATLAFSPSPIADWNMRPAMITRSPSAPSAKPSPTATGSAAIIANYLRTNGAWALQTSPIDPSDASTFPQLGDGGLISENPFIPTALGPAENVVLFDVPDPQTSVLSIADFRHAPLLQHSYHPTYIIGSSTASIHAPRMYTANRAWSNQTATSAERYLQTVLGGGAVSDVGPSVAPPFIGGSSGRATVISNFDHIFPKEQSGAAVNFNGVDGTNYASTVDIPFYDSVFETNQNLWDQFFVSGVPLESGGNQFIWNRKAPSINQRYVINETSARSDEDIENNLNSQTDSIDWAFWNMAEVLKVEGQFNVNSTSVNAWRAFLSSNRQFALTLKDEQLIGKDQVKYSRVSQPEEANSSSTDLLSNSNAWDTARILSGEEVELLAQMVVKEVKDRGPFMSLADFINRRLDDGSNVHSLMGALDSAIEASGLNNQILNELPILSNDSTDANHQSYSDHVNTTGGLDSIINSAPSRGYGFPGYLVQNDILASLASSMTVRGESFVIRTYGDSMENGVVKARAYLEAVVVRTPSYVDNSNDAVDANFIMNYSTGEIQDGNLSEINKKFGREFVVQSTRWLSGSES